MCLPGAWRLGGAIERRLQALVHQGGRAGAEPLDRELAAAGAVGALRPARGSPRRSRSSTAGSASRNWNSASALPGMMLFSPGSSVDAPRGPHRARAADLREARVDRAEQPHQLEARVAPALHGGGAGVVLLARHREAVLPDGDDRGDDADLAARYSRACRPARCAPRRTRRSAPDRSGGAGARTSRRLPAPRASAARRAGWTRRRSRSPRAAPMNERLPRKLPKWPSSSQNTTTSTPRSPGRGVLGDGPRGLQRVDAAQADRRASRHGSGFPGASRTAPCGRAPGSCRGCWRCRRWRRRGPASRMRFTNHSRAAMSSLRQRRAMHAGLVGAEGGERAQIGQHALGIDLRHFRWLPSRWQQNAVQCPTRMQQMQRHAALASPYVRRHCLRRDEGEGDASCGLDRPLPTIPPSQQPIQVAGRIGWG